MGTGPPEACGCYLLSSFNCFECCGVICHEGGRSTAPKSSLTCHSAFAGFVHPVTCAPLQVPPILVRQSRQEVSHTTSSAQVFAQVGRTLARCNIDTVSCRCTQGWKHRTAQVVGLYVGLIVTV